MRATNSKVLTRKFRHNYTLVAIGQDAAKTAIRLYARDKVIQARHPSYGGQTQFLTQMSELYGFHGSNDLGVDHV